MEQQQQQQYIVDFDSLKMFPGDSNLRIVQLGDEQIMQVPEEISDGQQIVYQQTSPPRQQPQQIHQQQYVLQHTDQQLVSQQQQVTYAHQTHLRQQHVPQQIYYTSTAAQPQTPQPQQIVYRNTQQSPPHAQQPQLVNHNGQIILQQPQQQQVIIQHSPQMQQQQQQQRLTTQIQTPQQRIIYPRVVFATQTNAQQQPQQQNQQIIRQHPQLQHIQPQMLQQPQQRPATPQNQNIVFHSVQQHQMTGDDQSGSRVVRTTIPQKLVIPNAIPSVRAKPSILTPQGTQNVVMRTTRPRGGGTTRGRGRGGGAVLATARSAVNQNIRHQAPNAVKIADGASKIVRGANAVQGIRITNTGVRPKLQIRKTITGEDIEDNIQAVMVKKEEQSLEGATLTQYENEEHKRVENGSSITILEYKQRQQQQQARLQQAQRQGGNVQYRMPIAAGQSTGQQVMTTTRTVPANRIPTMVTSTPTPVPVRPATQQVITEVQAPSTSVMKTSHNNYEIHSQNVISNRTIQQQQTPNRTISEVDKNSAKMLVILASGEQRLITFTLPKESCTVQDLLEQVGVPFDESTSIQCVESPGRDIDFVVTVGFNMQESPSDIISRAEQTLQNQQQQHQQQQQQLQQQQQQAAAAAAAASVAAQQKQLKVLEKPSPKPIPELPPRKLISGFLAVCKNCGFSGADHAKCERCKRVFTEEPKKICVPPSVKLPISSLDGGSPTRKPNQLLQRSQIKAQNALAGTTGATRGRGGSKVGRGGRLVRKPVEEPVVFTLSSDEEDDENSKTGNSLSNAVQNNDDSTFVEKPLDCEPEIPDDPEIAADFQRGDVTDLSDTRHKLSTSFLCKIIRIGTYRVEDPKGFITLTSKGIRLLVPSCNDPSETVTLDIQLDEIIKIIYHFSPSLNVLLLYNFKRCSDYVRESLDMKPKVSGVTIETPYYNSKEILEPYKRIVLVLKDDTVIDEVKNVLRSVFQKNILDEIAYADATTLIERSSSKDKFVALSNDTSAANLQNSQAIRQLLIYPRQGKGGIAINTEDYTCLATEQYLNDIIIEFYLKWLFLEVLTEEQRQKTHIFSTFFYKRLTTVTQHRGEKLTAAQKRHARVQKWTKDVNLFEKDFIIVPINEQSHWFLAIICFPKLKGPVDFDTEQPIKVAQTNSKKKKSEKRKAVQIGNTTITPLVKKDEMTVTLEGEDSERDEAEGDDSEMASEDSDSENTPLPQEQRLKQPMILIFDSLAGASRNRVVATLRDYLSCEYIMKEKQAGRAPATTSVFTKDNMQGYCVKCPQQNNFTDCGLFLLQYVEHFFKDPILNYKVPIKQLVNWFENIVVTRKREEISNLIKDLVRKTENGKSIAFPDIILPTMNGELLEIEESESRDENFEEEDDDNDPNFEVNSAASESPDKAKGTPTIGKKVVLKRSFREVADLQTNPLPKKAPKIETPTST
ncbi:SENP6 family protein [Megaselia abdita]